VLSLRAFITGRRRAGTSGKLGVSGKVARRFDSATLALLPLPFAAQSFDWSLYWHRRHDSNAAAGDLQPQLSLQRLASFYKIIINQ
jgi:hypothetical protein